MDQGLEAKILSSFKTERVMLNKMEDLQKLGKENMDVMMQSVGVMTKGLQGIAVEMADFQKKSFEDSASAMEKLAASKSLDKAFEAQTDYVKSAYEGVVGEMTKIGEMYTEIARDAYKPYETIMSKNIK